MSTDIDLFQLLDNFPVSCIYAFVDEPTKSVYAHISENNSIMQLTRTITELKRNIHNNKLLQDAYNRKTLSLKVLKDYNGSPPPEFIIRAECNDLINKSGYTDMRGTHPPAYRIKKRLLTDYSDLSAYTPLVYVTARYSNGEPIVLGIFDDMVEADAWIESVYPNMGKNKVAIPLFALNERTREYHKLHGYKLLT